MLTMTSLAAASFTMCASTSSSSSAAATAAFPLRSIPGSYGLPLVGPLRDRLDYFWLQGPETFFRRRSLEHKSTVFRTNMPPTFPFFIGVDPRVIAILDCASFSALFDLSVVEKKNVLVGDYMPSVAFTGNTRVAVYMDPSESRHSAVKNFCLDILRRSSALWVSEFIRHANAMLDAVEHELRVSSSSSFIVPLQKCIFAFLTTSLVGADPSKKLGDRGWVMLDTWLALQLLPVTKVGALPQPLEELLLHSFPFPFWPVSGDYKKLYQFVEKEGTEVLERGEREFGLSKEEAIHNILFVLGFNAFGGFTVFLPSLITTLGRDKSGLQQRLKDEVRRVLAGKRSICFETVKEMELVRSTVYEVLRLNPPVALQYARARKDFVLKSHEASYEVKKGELLCGYQPLAMRDRRVFEDPEAFVPDRFLKDEELLRYLYWSNGPETDKPSAANKQCAAKDYVVSTACMLVALIFTRYDAFQCDESDLAITKLDKATGPAVAT